MANTDAPRGFTPIKHLNGTPYTGAVQTIGVADGEDIFIGDMINLESGLADPMATDDAAVLGCVVGVGKNSELEALKAGAFNPADLTTLYYDDSASTHTDFFVAYVPADDMIFQVQTNADLDLVVGDNVDLVDGAGNTKTGRSIQEVGTSTNADFVVVEIPQLVDNDNSLANAEVYVTVTHAEQAFK